MRIIHNPLLPLPGYKAMNLCGLILVRSGKTLTPRDLTHEDIHTRQMRETLYLGFYIWYAIEWLLRLLPARLDGHRAYRALLLEREAYAHQDEPLYPGTRPRYAWLRK